MRSMDMRSVSLLSDIQVFYAGGKISSYRTGVVWDKHKLGK